MSSTAINRPSGTVQNAGRSTRFGDFTSTVNRSSVDDKISQDSTLSQSFGNGTWQASGGIWGNNAIGSGFSNGKREASRPRVTDGDGFPGASGSGALAASSEADTWVSRNGPWNVDTTSPTISTAGSASPMIHRGSGPLILTDTSPYLSTSRPAIGQGSGLNGNRSQGKSSLDPASGPFKYPFQKPSTFGFTDDKENLSQINGIVQSLESYDFDQRSYRKNGSTSRDTSGPPSRHSENGSNGNGNGSFFTNGQYPSYSHTPHNSLQRPPTQGRVPSFPSSASGRSYTDLASLTDAEANLSRFKEAQNAYTEASIDQPYSSPNYRGYSVQQSQSGSSGMWNNGLRSASKGLNNYALENSTENALFEHFNSSKPTRFNDRGSTSPGNDYRRQPTSPSYYQINEPSPSEPDPAFVRALRAQSVAELEHSMQRLQFAPQPPFFPHQPIYSAQFQGQYPPHAYDYPPQHNFRQPHNQYGYQIPAPMIVPRGPSRDQDEGLGFRSALLEEFRCNSKSNKRYELKDIYNHVVEFSGDQHGSRFIQQKLETANSDEKDQIFREIQPNALQLMTDVFGNYVIQKLFEHGNQLQKKALAEQMKNHVNELSVQMYGCRVVQKALEHVLADQQAELVRELQHDILKCVKDQNGNHVVQKAIERVPTADIQFIIEAFKGQVHTLATHPYGCRVIQRMLEYCSDKDQAAVLEELHACASMLITDQYGNYVMQHVIAHGKPEDRAKIIKIVTAQLLTLSKHKFASNVVEKTIQYGSDEQRRAIVAQLTAQHSDGSSPLQLMMKDQYGNYVIQKLLLQLKGAERDRFVEDMKPQLAVLKKYNYGKQITAIEKLISTGPSPPSSSHNNNIYTAPSITTQVMPLDLSSSAVTPVLTKGQNSPESSGLPSTNASAVDEPTQSGTIKSEDVERGMPEVRIEAVQ